MRRSSRRRTEIRSGPRLFAPEDLELRPSAAVRLGMLARAPSRPATERERRREEERRTMDRLREWGADLRRRFGLRESVLEPEREGVTAHYGICYEDGLIRVRLRHARTGRLLKESSLVDTLCHELAHLAHLNHGPRFKRLYQRILEEARRLGYYRPGPRDDGRPKQRLLFGVGACGTEDGPHDGASDAETV